MPADRLLAVDVVVFRPVGVVVRDDVPGDGVAGDVLGQDVQRHRCAFQRRMLVAEIAGHPSRVGDEAVQGDPHANAADDEDDDRQRCVRGGVGVADGRAEPQGGAGENGHRGDGDSVLVDRQPHQRQHRQGEERGDDALPGARHQQDVGREEQERRQELRPARHPVPRDQHRADDGERTDDGRNHHHLWPRPFREGHRHQEAQGRGGGERDDAPDAARADQRTLAGVDDVHRARGCPTSGVTHGCRPLRHSRGSFVGSLLRTSDACGSRSTGRTLAPLMSRALGVLLAFTIGICLALVQRQRSPPGTTPTAPVRVPPLHPSPCAPVRVPAVHRSPCAPPEWGLPPEVRVPTRIPRLARRGRPCPQRVSARPNACVASDVRQTNL